jgi:hypothetical protein
VPADQTVPQEHAPEPAPTSPSAYRNFRSRNVR